MKQMESYEKVVICTTTGIRRVLPPKLYLGDRITSRQEVPYQIAMFDIVGNDSASTLTNYIKPLLAFREGCG